MVKMTLEDGTVIEGTPKELTDFFGKTHTLQIEDEEAEKEPVSLSGFRKRMREAHKEEEEEEGAEEVAVESPVEDVPKYKVGDFVKITDRLHGHDFDINDIVQLVGEGYEPNLRAERVTDGEFWYIKSDEFIRASEEEIQRATTKPFKPGDRAVVLRNPTSLFLAGTKVTVLDFDGEHYLVRPIGGGCDGYADEFGELEHIEEREPGEFYIGDIVRLEDGSIDEVVAVKELGYFCSDEGITCKRVGWEFANGTTLIRGKNGE